MSRQLLMSVDNQQGHGRKAKGEATRQRIVESAAELFHAQGVDGTGLEQILRQAGAGKSQFYQHFRNKDALVCEVAVWWEHRLFASMEVHELDSLDTLERWLLSAVDQLEVEHCYRGCPIGTLAAGLHDNDETTRAAVSQCFRALDSRLRDALHQSQQRGELSEEADLEAISHFILASQQGAATLTKAYGESSAGRLVIVQAMQYVRSYSVNGQEQSASATAKRTPSLSATTLSKSPLSG
ncbi:TetR/AcrR family transcriptional regulator [Vreelandella lionensis]|uniref:TetR/AcrR family transcriptional regulator n=1 Tax=Halomonadaceae TaxID=28256 RepID=UPI00137476F7|nr:MULTISPECIES: TetR/AcrR family transcriptional regulator [Halomonas]MCP1318685.1 TetR/AcrR family transcriptional regulator [Halomonas sp. 707B3]